MGSYLIDEKAIGNYLVQMEADETAGTIRVTLSKTDNGWSYETLLATHRADRKTAYEDFNDFIATAERSERR